MRARRKPAQDEAHGAGAPRAQEKGTQSFESSTFHLREEESEHEHNHTSTSEDDLLELLGTPDDTRTWTQNENLSDHLILVTILGDCY